MKERFKGKTLIEALMRQELIACDLRIARRVAAICRVVDIEPGVQFILDGEKTSDVFLILQGTADVFIKGSLVATRTEGQHVGEMASLLNSRRTAGVRARTATVAAKISRSHFLKIAGKFPSIWRGVARTLAIRLDHRRNLIREQNLRPQIFIASATESKAVAKALKTALTDARWDLEVWDEEQVFTPSKVFIEVLEEKAKRSDFGIAVFGRDDKTTKRKKTQDAPRDNTVLEGGMFIGAAGRLRTFFLIPDGKSFQKPTDLDGVVMLEYKKTTRTIDVTAAARKIRGCIEKLGVR